MFKTQLESSSQANMSLLMKRSWQLQSVLVIPGDIFTEVQILGRLQAQSCLGLLQKSLSGHPDIRQGKQGHALRGVLGKAPIAHLAVTELVFDDLKRMLHFGAHTGPDLLGLLGERTPGRMLLQLAFTGTHGDVPVHAGDIFSFGRNLIPRIGEYNLFLTMEQCVALDHIVGAGSGSDDRVYKDGIGIHANVSLHPEVLLVALLGLMHLGVTLAGLVLGRAGRLDRRGSYHGAGLEQQSVVGEFGVNDLQNLRTQVVLFEQVSEPQNAGPIGNTLGAADTGEIAQEAGLKQGLFGSQVGQFKPLLQAVRAQQHRKFKRWAFSLGHRVMRLYQCKQLAPWHDLLHLVEKNPFAQPSHIWPSGF